MVEKDPSARLRRAVKENNLFMVKRLIQRTDMRNPDPGPRRLTSLAWAAAMGHEETFEYLLSIGHDDLELSKDSENNTILMLMAELTPGGATPYKDPDLVGAALRMARLYYDRYPFILDWSNVHGKTALHLSALKGNEELAKMFCELGSDFDLSDNLGNTPLHYASAWGHVSVVQLLIERGCQFASPNNDGFTASDYAYSYSTKDTLQSTARIQYETNKQNKKQRRNEQAAAARAASLNIHPEQQEWAAQHAEPLHLPPLPKIPNRDSPGTVRMRSGSGGSRTTTATSDSGDVDGLPTLARTSAPSIARTGSSQTQQPPSSSTSTFSLPSPGPPTANTMVSATSTVSPIVTRMRERDADAIAEYMKRNRSTSSGTQSTTTTTDVRASPASAIPPVPPLNAHLSKTASFTQRRRLRPSASAAQLRSTPPAIVTRPSMDGAGPVGHRSRSGTNPVPPVSTEISQSPQPQLNANGGSTGTLTSRPSARRVGTTPERPTERVVLPRDAIEESRSRSAFQGPSAQYATFPEPPAPPEKDREPDPLATPTRRMAFNLLKPLPSISDPALRGHRRGISATTLRT